MERRTKMVAIKTDGGPARGRGFAIDKVDGGQIGWRFGLRWVLLALAGLIASLPLFLVLAGATEWIAGIAGVHKDILEKFNVNVGNACLEISIGAMVGFVQWLGLRCIIPRAGFWVVANIIGFTVSSCLHAAMCVWGLPDDLGFPLGVLGWAIAFVVGGALSGVMQYRILRRHVRQSGWWVPASAIGWGLGVIGFGISALALHVESRSLPVHIVCNLAVPLIMASVFYGIVTGWTLIWLLRQPIQQTPYITSQK